MDVILYTIRSRIYVVGGHEREVCIQGVVSQTDRSTVGYY